MRIRLLPFLLPLLLLPVACGRGQQAVEEEPLPELPRLGFFADSLLVEEWSVQPGETFTGLFTRIGMTSDESFRLAQACDSVFDVRRLRAGNGLEVYFDSLGHEVKYVVYNNDRIHQTVFKCFDSLAVWTSGKEVEYERKYADVKISSSLWNDMTCAGASPLLILKLSDIYAWTVDFFGLHEGDRFRMLYGQTLCEDEIISVDTVYYAVFEREGRQVPAILFDQGDGGNQYWNAEGQSLKKAFLKAPLQFTRISSGFSYARKHPVTGKIRPHTAIDYAAPAGTPVMSIGDGTVLSAGWAGGGGNTVKIRHNASYVTSYMHLSRYAKGLKAGQHVHQGQVIGYVGATGTATGPHLDFRVYKDGTAINPLKMESPSADPIRPENLPALDSVRRVYEAMALDLGAGSR
ncbi:MAG: peptidoglycan DD-metalloendopeptidase family protein [Bacteroidales bacterium]|nr:peptidoglycan DD-metalloendopeptidase family protein [Bacteroidales bacterium]